MQEKRQKNEGERKGKGKGRRTEGRDIGAEIYEAQRKETERNR